METPSAQPPRPAATVVVLRDRPGGAPPEIFMVRRSARSAFMPNTLVFPGGKVDAADGLIDADEAFVAAARRETLEEAQLALEPGALRWFDTWITPSAEPRRFYARFYVARLGGGEGHEAAADGHETHEGRWASAAEHLAAWEAGEVDLPPPTACTLMRLAAPDWEALLGWPRAIVEAPILPKWLGSEGRMEVVMPHDPEYDALPGEAAPRPGRLEGLPRRFVRDGKIWRPQP
ncbi:MAG: NUDIX hydrolase [Myxococcales bacterium]|nr:NUDIX hydrolase [Myxococcales bacterium]